MGARQSGFVRMGFRRAGQASGGGGGSITLVQGSSPIHVVNGSGPTVTVSHDLTAVTPGSYTNVSATVNATGHITAMASGPAPVTNVTASAPIASSGGATPNITHNDSALGAAVVTFPSSITFDAKGHPTAAVSGNAPQGILVAQLTGNSNTASFPFAANAYKKIAYYLNWTAAVSITNLKLTGLIANAYNEGGSFGLYGGSSGTFSSAAANTQWLQGASNNGPGDAQGDVYLPPAPLTKRHKSSVSDSIAARLWFGHSTDTANDPTAMVFTFSGATPWTLWVWGWT